MPGKCYIKICNIIVLYIALMQNLRVFSANFAPGLRFHLALLSMVGCRSAGEERDGMVTVREALGIALAERVNGYETGRFGN